MCPPVPQSNVLKQSYSCAGGRVVVAGRAIRVAIEQSAEGILERIHAATSVTVQV